MKFIGPIYFKGFSLTINGTDTYYTLPTYYTINDIYIKINLESGTLTANPAPSHITINFYKPEAKLITPPPTTTTPTPTPTPTTTATPTLNQINLQLKPKSRNLATSVNIITCNQIFCSLSKHKHANSGTEQKNIFEIN